MGAAPGPEAWLLDRVVAAVGDRYDVRRELGRGALSVVFLAQEVRLRRPVALKILPPEFAYRAGVRERFLREAQTAAQLHHPHVVPVFAAGDEQGVAWLAMAYVDGETLGARLARERQLPAAEARRILLQVADALAYAHAHGVVHRDVKPDNVLLDRESGRALVTDFGIARAAEDHERLTVTGNTVGTPAYMSPEQALGERAVDGRSDQYALGVVAYQMLTGALPFEAGSATAMLMKHVAEPCVPVRARAPEVPAALAAVVERALAKKPEERWPDAAAFRRALDEAAHEPPPAAPDPRGAAETVAVPGLVREVRDALFGGPVFDAAPPTPPRRDPVGAWLPEQAPPLPPPPTPPDVHASSAEKRAYREARQAWREEQRELRALLKERERDARDDWREAQRAAGRAGVSASVDFGSRRGGAVAAPPPAPDDPELLLLRATAFQRKFYGSLMGMIFLAFINVATSPVFPWAIFPIWGIARGLVRRWRPLGEAGLSFSSVVMDAPAMAVGQRGAGTRAPLPEVRHVRRHVRGYRRTLVGAGFFALFMLAWIFPLLRSGDGGEMFALGFVLAAGFAVRGLWHRRRLLALGIGEGMVWNGRWREVAALQDPRPRDQRLAEEARRLAGDAVVRGPHGAALVAALDDRLAVRETLAKLAPADRALIPDVTPTVDGLAEKVVGLVQALHRLDDGLPPGALAELEARLAAAQAEPSGAPDRDRRVQLLERQRASLADLAQRRATLAAQLESARLVLQNVKLDLLKLRHAGVGALAEPATVTQEARALSREIGYALEAAAEVRGR